MPPDHKSKMKHAQDTAAEITDAAMYYATNYLKRDMAYSTNHNHRVEIFTLAAVYARTAARVYTNKQEIT